MTNEELRNNLQQVNELSDARQLEPLRIIVRNLQLAQFSAENLELLELAREKGIY